MAKDEDTTKIVDIPRLILMKSGKGRRYKNKLEALKLETADNYILNKSVVSLPAITSHQDVQDKKRRIIK